MSKAGWRPKRMMRPRTQRHRFPRLEVNEDRAALVENELFEVGPLLALQTRLGLRIGGRVNLRLRIAIVVLLGWVPLLALSSMRGDVGGIGTSSAFFTDIAAHARFLIAPPLLIVAGAISAPYLTTIAWHFLDAGLISDADRPRFNEATASIRSALQSPKVPFGLILLAYVVAFSILIAAYPTNQLSAWQMGQGGSTASLSPAGWWHWLVSVPLLLVLVLGWLWKLGVWARFLYLTSRMELQLFPAHPDRAAGLAFVGLSLRAFSLPVIALGTIVAGVVANNLSHRVVTPPGLPYLIAGALLISVGLFSVPLLLFSGRLIRERRRAVFHYGALAGSLGRKFEPKGTAEEDDEVTATRFSTICDFNQVISGIYPMRLVPADLVTFILLAGAFLIPFVPVALMVMPLNEIIKEMSELLL